MKYSSSPNHTKFHKNPQNFSQSVQHRHEMKTKTQAIHEKGCDSNRTHQRQSFGAHFVQMNTWTSHVNVMNDVVFDVTLPSPQHPTCTFSRFHLDVCRFLPNIFRAQSELPIMFNTAALISNAVGSLRPRGGGYSMSFFFIDIKQIYIKIATYVYFFVFICQFIQGCVHIIQKI